MTNGTVTVDHLTSSHISAVRYRRLITEALAELGTDIGAAMLYDQVRLQARSLRARPGIARPPSDRDGPSLTRSGVSFRLTSEANQSGV